MNGSLPASSMAFGPAEWAWLRAMLLMGLKPLPALPAPVTVQK